MKQRKRDIRLAVILPPMMSCRNMYIPNASASIIYCFCLATVRIGLAGYHLYCEIYAYNYTSTPSILTGMYYTIF